MVAPSPSELGYQTLGDGGDGPTIAGGAARTVRSDSDDRLQAFLSRLDISSEANAAAAVACMVVAPMVSHVAPPAAARSRGSAWGSLSGC